MNNTLTVLASILCISLLQPATAQQAIDYFPLCAGNYWVHRTDTLGGVYDPATYRMEVPAVEEVGGEQLYLFKETTAADDGSPAWCWYSWLRVDPEGIVIAALGDTSLVDSAIFFESPVLWWPNAMINQGYTWEFDSYEMGGHFSFVVESIAVTIEVPAGTFDNCIKIGLTQSTEGDTTQKSWHYYAPGVGQVLNTGSNTWFGGSFRFELVEYSVETVSVDCIEQEIPRRFHVHQNYPNPFNPASTIRYDLPKGSDVSLVVYDILGREVARLVDGYIEPGYHQVQWDGKNQYSRIVPSGIYIARLVTLRYSKSIKMVLVR
ncbi:MAG: T9SS type A sorting domain-containing protein [Candidatus Neomarinimicrobiota bacterium]